MTTITAEQILADALVGKEVCTYGGHWARIAQLRVNSLPGADYVITYTDGERVAEKHLWLHDRFQIRDPQEATDD